MSRKAEAPDYRVMVAVDVQTVERLDRLAKLALQGVTLSRTACIRMCIERGLSELEEEHGKARGKVRR